MIITLDLTWISTLVPFLLIGGGLGYLWHLGVDENKETEVINDEKNKAKIETLPASNLFDSKDFENNDFEREFNKSLSFLHDFTCTP